MIEIWVSHQEVWWNRGVEVKPSRKAFSNFTFEKVNNFNVSWIDELHINVIVPNGKKANLIKIIDPNDDDGVNTKYYFLMEVLNKTNKNKECIYQLDVWLTFILNSDFLGVYNDFRTIRNLRLEDVNKFIEIEPVGTPTGRVESKLVEFNLGDFKAPQEYREMYGEETFKLRKTIPSTKSGDDLDINAQDGEQIYGYDDNVYFVFTEWKNNYHSSGLLNHNRNNYVLIPVLNISLLGFYTYIPRFFRTAIGFTSGATNQYSVGEVPYGSSIDKPDIWKTINRYNSIAPMVYLNSLRNLLKLVENYKDIQAAGLGEFVGVWIGPSFWRIKNGEYSTSGLTRVNEKVIWNCYPNLFSVFIDTDIVARERGFEFVYSPDLYIPEMTRIKQSGGFNGSKRWAYFRGQVSKNDYDNQTNEEYILKNKNWDVELFNNTQTGFLALKVSANSLKLEELNEDWMDYLKNYKYFDLSNLTRDMNTVFFNRKFTFTNGKDNVDLDIQVPTGYDNYQNLLKQQEASMNTSLKLSGANAIMSALGGAFGLVAPEPTQTTTFTSQDVDLTRDINTQQAKSAQMTTGFSERFLRGRKIKETRDRFWATSRANPERDLLMNATTSHKFEKDKKIELTRGVLRGGTTTTNTGAIRTTGTRNTLRNTIRSGGGIGASGIIGAGMGAARGLLQFASTLAQQQAYKQSLRIATSNTITNYTDTYSQYFLHLTRKKNIKIKDINDINDSRIRDFMNKELLYGTTTETGKQYKFYGFEDIPKPLTARYEPPVITPILDDEAYILIDELTKFNLEIKLSDKFSPTIKEAILSLLTNGVRMTQNLTPYTTFFEIGDDNESEST